MELELVDQPISLAAFNKAVASFAAELDVRYLDGDRWLVLSPFIYISANPVIPTVCVPAGFTTDFGSVPRFFWSIIHPTDKYLGKPAVIHDWLYREPTIPVTREQADRELEVGMKLMGAGWFKRNVVHRAVRLFGGGAFVERK